MIGLKIWDRRNREIGPEFQIESLKELAFASKAIAEMRSAGKKGKYAVGPVCRSCILDPTAEYVVRS